MSAEDGDRLDDKVVALRGASMDTLDTNDVIDGLEARALALFTGVGRRIRTGRLDEHDREHWIA